MLVLGPVQGQLPPAELKAQVLVKVLRFVEWPGGALSASQPLQLCTTDAGALAHQLQRFDGQALQERAIAVRALPAAARIPAQCHVAVVANPAAWSAGPGTLLVSEESGALDRGAMLGLQVEDGRVVFDVELDAARRAGIEFSARLLRLARFVKKGGG